METYVTYRVLSYGSGDLPEEVVMPIDADEIEVVNLAGYTVEDPQPMFFTVDSGGVAEWGDFSEIVTPNSSLTVRRKFSGNAVVYIIGNGMCCVRGVKNG
jgi:hypothetical protein